MLEKISKLILIFLEKALSLDFNIHVIINGDIISFELSEGILLYCMEIIEICQG